METVAENVTATEAVPVAVVVSSEVVQKPRKQRQPKPEPTPEQVALKLALNKLHEVSPEEWERRIGAIRNQSVQVRTACIVWWDYFGQRLVHERWPNLDRFLTAAFRHLNPLPDPAPGDVVAALESVGYPKEFAANRVTGAELEG